MVRLMNQPSSHIDSQSSKSDKLDAAITLKEVNVCEVEIPLPEEYLLTNVNLSISKG